MGKDTCADTLPLWIAHLAPKYRLQISGALLLREAVMRDYWQISLSPWWDTPMSFNSSDRLDVRQVTGLSMPPSAGVPGSQETARHGVGPKGVQADPKRPGDQQVFDSDLRWHCLEGAYPILVGLIRVPAIPFQSSFLLMWILDGERCSRTQSTSLHPPHPPRRLAAPAPSISNGLSP